MGLGFYIIARMNPSIRFLCEWIRVGLVSEFELEKYFVCG